MEAVESAGRRRGRPPVVDAVDRLRVSAIFDGGDARALQEVARRRRLSVADYLRQLVLMSEEVVGVRKEIES